MTGSGICVIGREGFSTGIGSISAAAVELLGRRYQVDLHTPSAPSGWHDTVLPTGTLARVTPDPSGYATYFYADVLWNGASDFNVHAMPLTGYRIAHMAFDSDRLPPEWVRILNERFHLALFSSPYLVDVAVASGVRIDCATLPIGLPLEPLLARPYRRPVGDVVRFGSISAFHRRKNLDLLVNAFLETFGRDPGVELLLHSNLDFGDTLPRIRATIEAFGAQNVILSHSELSEHDKTELLDSFDVYVNTSAGEGYSIGPREALALGKPVVLSRVPAHDELQDVPGAFAVESVGRMPARYPEIDNRVFGTQSLFRSDEIGTVLRAARAFVEDGPLEQTVCARRARAAEFSNSALAADYARVVDPDSALIPTTSTGSAFSSAPGPSVGLARAAAGRYGTRLGSRHLVLRAHDGGFFSLFNAYLSHLTWSRFDDDVSLVLPDWRPAGVIARAGGAPVSSFCYGRPEDGNVWTKLFEPPLGLSIEDLDDPDILDVGVEEPAYLYNQVREPSLTYVNAHDLYLSHDFPRFRRQYHAALAEHVHLLPAYRREFDAFHDSRMRDRLVVGVHVKHPSHVVEQVSGRMADRFEYLERVREELRARGVRPGDPDWAVFLATDQQRVRDLFEDEFGDHLIAFDDVTRSATSTDEAYDVLGDDDKLQQRHQIQHQMAQDTANWSTRLAWEVWRDAMALAGSDVVIHAISNVATAVSYLNPDNDMRYYEG